VNTVRTKQGLTRGSTVGQGSLFEIVVGRFHEESTTRLLDGAERCPNRLGVQREDVVLACLVLILIPVMLVGQQNQLDLGRWRNFTDMKTVRAIAATTDSLWVATSGGLFLFNPSSNAFAKFTNSEGLSSNDLTAVTIDGTGRVWVGSSDGFINSYTPTTGEWVAITAIEESDRVQKGIRSILARGDSLFIATDFGITVLQISRREFKDTYANLGFATQAGVNNVKIFKNRIWAATDLGVSSASLDAPNLSAPTSWTAYGTADGLPSSICTVVTSIHDTIVAGTSNGLAIFTGNQFLPVPAFSGKAVTDLLARANDVVVLTNEGGSFKLTAYAGIGSPSVAIATNTGLQGNALAGQPLTTNVWVGTASSGIARWTGAWEYTVPNCPRSSLFSSVVVDDRGILWAASGISGRGQGFYRFDLSAPDNARWKGYTMATDPLMNSDDYYKVSLGANGSIWVSSWGWGAVEVVNDSIRRHLDQSSTPALAGAVPQNPSFVVVGGVGVDSQGDTWIVDRSAINGNHIVQLKSNNSVVYRTSPSSDGKLTNILIDHNDTKWFANSEPTDKPPDGLFYFNEDSTVNGTRSSGGWGQLTTSDGLPSSIVLSLALDLNGEVCIGTDLGMVIVNDPLNPKGSIVPRTPLRGQSIQAIAVDAVNNKWVGTKEGVIVVNSDATAVLGQYTVLSTNGKLVDDDIRSIAYDQKRGIMYFGTIKGLSSLEVAAEQTLRSITTLDVGPNPYLVPSTTRLTIRNLSADASIKIIMTSGALVLQFKAQGGGRAFWDGRDSEGNVVPSGIYFVVAFSDNGNQTGTAKIAVVRR
jgi:ligand-binding sensor domain-containing protein